jgi:glutamine synthetase type III
MGSAVLGEAIGAIRDWSISKSSEPAGQAAEAFGSLVFNDAEQQKRLPKSVYNALRKTIVGAEPLDPSVADAVAKAAK